MIEITINNRTCFVPPGRTILEACREYGIPVPTLCFHPALEPYGGCRLCMVEISQSGRKPRLVTACTYPCEAGLAVQTDTAAVRHSRRLTAELLMAGAGHVAEIAALARELGVETVRYRLPEEDACVLCGLCVRACQEIVGVSAISMIHRGIAKQVSPPFETTSTVCIGCGTCVLICPTEAIMLEQVTDYHSQHQKQVSTDLALVEAPAGMEYLDCRLCSQEMRKGV